jgi:hypothetical protein
MGKAMGIGLVGNPDITFKRVFRFTFEIRGFCNNQSSVIPEHFVMTAGRPKLEVEETQIDHLNARTWIPGKASWQTITVKYMDVAHATNVSLWTWMATIYSLGDPVNLTMGNKRDWDERDIAGAKALGMKTAFARYGDDFNTLEPGADFELSDINQLVDIIKKLNGSKTNG